MATFLVTTYGTNGDVLPFVRIGQALRARGHEVVLHTHAYYADTARAAGLDFVAVDTEEEYARTLRDSQRLLLNVLADVDHLADFYERNGLWDQIRQEYESMAALVADRDPAQVVAVSRHTSGLSVLMLREAHRVPAAWLALSPTLFMAEPLTERLFPRSLAGSANAVRTAVGLPALDDWGPWLSSADLQVGLWPQWFDTAGDPAPRGAALPGFVMHDDAESGTLPAEVEALVGPDVPAERRPVLLTGGSGQLIHEEWYRVAAEACARTGRPGILVCRHRDLVPARLPDGVIWQPSLPFRTLMPRVAAVVHHGGVLTCARAIASGVPQVILAHGTDRPDNAARLRRLGLAEWLPAARWTTEAVSELLTRVLTDPRYAARNAALAPQIASRQAVEDACDRLESLIGTRADARPTTTTTRETPVRDRIQQLSPEQRALLLRRLKPTPRAPRTQDGEVLDCSSNQRRSWLAAQVDPTSLTLHVTTAVRLRGTLDVPALAAAVDEVVARHDALRTVAVQGGDGPRQRVLGEVRAPLRVESSADAARGVERVRREPFDLDKGPLVRTALLEISPRENVFVLVGHHFVMDAASLGVVMGEVAASYSARTTGSGPAFDGPPVQYPDVAAHQRRVLAGGGAERSMDHWRTVLAGVEAPPTLPLPAPGTPGEGVGAAVRMLPPDLVERLSAATGQVGRTGLAPALLTTYQLLLGRWTARSEVPVGVVVGGRTQAGTERVVGDFANVVVVRCDLSEPQAFAGAARRAGTALADALLHQDAPFEAVIAAVAPPRIPGRRPLVGFGFNMQDYRLDEVSWAGLSGEVVPTEAGDPSFEVTLTVLPTTTGEVKVVFEYAASQFAADAVEGLADQYLDLVRLLAAQPHRPVAQAVAALIAEPVPDAASTDVTAPPVEYLAPRTEGEALVAGVVAEVLKREEVGVHHDFFALGGHSLHAMQVIGRINAATGLEAPVRLIFTHPTVAGLTDQLEELAR